MRSYIYSCLYYLVNKHYINESNIVKAYLDVKTFEQLIFSFISHIALKSLFCNFVISTYNAYTDTVIPKIHVTNLSKPFAPAILVADISLNDSLRLKMRLTTDFLFDGASKVGDLPQIP